MSKIIPPEAKTAVIYAKLICEASVSIISSSPRDIGGLPVDYLSWLWERLGQRLLKAEEELLPELYWVFNSDCVRDLLNVDHLTNNLRGEYIFSGFQFTIGNIPGKVESS